jgi:hypothetical protein
VRVLEEVRREIDEAEGTTGYDRSLVFEEARLMATEIISAKLAALRTDGEGSAPPPDYCPAHDTSRENCGCETPPPAAREAVRVLAEEDGEVAIDIDSSNERSLSLNLSNAELGYALVWDGVSKYGRVRFDEPLPDELLAALRTEGEGEKPS